ncbi:Holliday junction branch migration DNA helicase RuvB [Nakamurella flava]|uniref:Holliday junction branch migration complex subunit RuvB n=1 Tax=Nakamurella flava TaxID=2576308 RepID=A0A4U6QIW0_9ACTN|nr:Holliday junction branch migration DNA helicase RuvB [Nakamurella flava]TKV60340.1 Holliday junction branch migration DNA helicase RuvB [Nakamurella flava]
MSGLSGVFPDPEDPGDDEHVEFTVDPHQVPADADVEASLRPKSLAEFIGQPRVREQLELVLTGAKLRGVPPDHVLLAGPPGLGKTSLSMIIAAELGASIRLTSGPALERAGDLAAILSNLVEGDVLFIDEIHRMARPAEEMLYLAMEDFRVDIVVGKGPGATSIPLDIAPFTLVGATTRSGQLTSPLRDRFGFTAHMEFYAPEELTQVITRSAAILGVQLRPDGATEIARRSRGTPRIANRLLRRVRDFADVRADGSITREVARAALAVYEVDELGLDRLDRSVLGVLCRTFGGGPVGITSLAVAVGEEPSTVEEVCEPFLVRIGLLARTRAGRVATPAAWEHLRLTPPRNAPVLGAAPGDSAGDDGLFDAS